MIYYVKYRYKCNKIKTRMGCGASESRSVAKVLSTKENKFICKLQSEEGDDMLIQPIGAFGETSFPAKITYESKKGRAYCMTSDKVYFSGGEDTLGEFGEIEINFSQRRTKVTFKQQMLCERAFHHIATVNDGMLMVLGGMNKEKEGFLKNVEIYNVQKDQWNSVAEMPEGKCGMGIASFKSRFVYCFGGYLNTRDVSNTIECYDVLTNVWSGITLTEGALNKRHGHMAMQLNSNEILVFGGEKAEENTPTYVFNVEKKSMTKIEPLRKLEGIIAEIPLPVARYKNRAYIIDPQTRDCHVYSSENQTWNIINVYVST